MDFQKIPTVLNSQEYLDIAFKAGRTNAKKCIVNSKSEVYKKRKIEIVKIEGFADKLIEHLKKLIKRFLRTEDMSDFYLELFKCYFDVDEYKKNLSRIKWAELQINKLKNFVIKSMKMSNTIQDIDKYSNEMFGRGSSVMKRIDKALDFIRDARKKFRKMPSIKEGCLNVAIAGFPNVGKSTLLFRFTKSKAEISSYAFTTKNLNLGYIKKRNSKMQMIDTPGTLNRFEKMNDIEKIAYIAIKNLSKHVIYVFDPTENYDIELQEKLYERIKKLNSNIICYCSKQDIADKNSVMKIKEKYDCKEIDELKDIFSEWIRNFEKEQLDNFRRQNDTGK
ncbi:MAG: GTPase [Nanobdellota archaeon]